MYVISYECISVCSMPIAVIGNAFTIVSFLTSQFVCCFFTPFEAGIYTGIPRTRDFCELVLYNPTRTRNVCEFCTTFIPVPELSIFVLSVGYTQNHTRGIYPGYYLTKNLCNFCRTLMSVPGTSKRSVRWCHKDPGYGYSMFIPARNFCKLRPCHNTRIFWKFVRLSYPYPELLKFL